jgi:hypothetical protein
MQRGKDLFAEHGAKYGGIEDQFFGSAGVAPRERELSEKLSRGAALAGASMAGSAVPLRGRPPGSSSNTIASLSNVNKATRAGAEQAGNLDSTLRSTDRERKLGALKAGRGAATATAGANNQALYDQATRDILASQVRDDQTNRNGMVAMDAAATGMGGLARLAEDANVNIAGGGAMDSLGKWLHGKGFTTDGREERALQERAKILDIDYKRDPGLLARWGARGD